MPSNFPLGSIPPLYVWEGEVLSFKVTSDLGSGSAYTKRATPAPTGKMSIDERTGAFTYEPSPRDREEIAVVIRARNGAKEVEQTVRITPHPRLPPEFRIIKHEVNPPKSAEFITWVEQVDAEKSVFNNTSDYEDNKKPEIQTSQITITGIELVLESGSKTNLLFERLRPRANPRNNLKRLTLCADTITIRNQLELPGTEVHLYARVLRFENDGAINTTPLSVTARASTRDEGLKGQKAGDVYLFVQKLEPSGKGPRIIARGGNGQPAREGRAGKRGKVVTPWDGKNKRLDVELDWSDDINEKASGYTPLFAEVYGKTITSEGRFLEDGISGTNDWPTDGGPPERLPGYPGQGGDGGSLFTGLPDQLNSMVALEAGQPGTKAPDVPASDAGSPLRSCHVVVDYIGYLVNFTKPRKGESQFVRRDKVIVKEKRDVKKGPGAQAPGPNPATPAGKPGSTKILQQDKAGPGYWLHPSTVRALLAYGNDAFVSGFTVDARKLLVSYRDAITAARLEKGDNIEWAALHGEVASLIERMDGIYDNFGNPAGWVPMLSLESNLKLYEAEINSAIRTMFLAYWMANIEKSGKSATASLTEALKQLREEGEKATEDYNAALAKLTDLDARLKNLNPEIEGFYVSLKKLEQELEKTARDDLQLEHTLRSTGKLLGGVMQLIPVGQPMLGAFGKGLTALSDIDLDKPFDTVPEVLGAFSEVAKQKLQPKAEALFTRFKDYLNEENRDGEKKDEEKKDTEKEKKPDPKKEELEKAVKKKELADKVKKYMDEQKEAKSQAMEAFKGFAVPEDEVKERLARAIAESPQYQDLVKRLEPLNAKKTALMLETLAALKTIDEASLTILNSQFARIELQAQLDKTLDQLSPEVFQYAQGMGQRARNRLLKYQYYLLKSYQFLMLEDLPSLDFRAQKMFDAFAKYIPGNTKVKPTDADFLPPSEHGDLSEKHFQRLSAIFEEQLRSVINTIIDFYENNPAKFDGKFEVELTKKQLETLNATGRLDIDLMQMGYHDFDREDIRIINIEASDVELASPPAAGLVNVFLTYRHEGISRLRRGGRLYLFRSGRYRVAADGKSTADAFRDAKMYWGSDVTYKARTKEYEITHRKPDEVEKWLVKHLLGEKETRDTSPLTSFRPSAWARITVTLSATPDRSAGKLKTLELKVYYASHNLSERLGTVFTRVSDDIEPLIRCDTTDVNGLSDGQGSFLRTFDVTQTPRVTITAPARYGGRSFEGWLIDEKPLTTRLARDNQGALWWIEGEEVSAFDPAKLKRTPTLVLDLTKQSSYTIEPYYGAAPAIS
jgi:hypothetical protein